MNSQSHATIAALLAGGLLTVAAHVQAFSFTTNVTPDNPNPKQNIFLQSVEQDGMTISNFSLVERANILYNDPYTGGNTGAASSDRGDKASGVRQEDATNESVVASLRNLNLNNIIDTEDEGSFKINLFFESAIDRLFFWERGMNSILGVQAIDRSGNLIGNLVNLGSLGWDAAGFGIDTKEIGATQPVGSRGINLAEFGLDPSVNNIAGIQVLARGSADNGPDFKVVGANVPEPATMAGLGLVAGAMAMLRRRKTNSQEA